MLSTRGEGRKGLPLVVTVAAACCAASAAAAERDPGLRGRRWAPVEATEGVADHAAGAVLGAEDGFPVRIGLRFGFVTADGEAQNRTMIFSPRAASSYDDEDGKSCDDMRADRERATFVHPFRKGASEGAAECDSFLADGSIADKISKGLPEGASIDSIELLTGGTIPDDEDTIEGKPNVYSIGFEAGSKLYRTCEKVLADWNKKINDAEYKDVCHNTCCCFWSLYGWVNIAGGVCCGSIVTTAVCAGAFRNVHSGSAEERAGLAPAAEGEEEAQPVAHTSYWGAFWAWAGSGISTADSLDASPE